MKGYSAETSGGIFCMIDPSKVKDFVREHKDRFGQDIWVVGEAVKSQTPHAPKAMIRSDVEVINVRDSFLHL